MSGSISDKIEYLQGTKEAIANAIIEQGVEVTEQDTFRSYAEKISQLGSPIKSVANTSSTTLILDESGQLTSNVNISSAENNLITINKDGLFLEASTVKTDAAAYIIESYIDGENGYRVWSDGVCEQWCYQVKKVTSGNLTWTFLKPFKKKPRLVHCVADVHYSPATEFYGESYAYYYIINDSADSLDAITTDKIDRPSHMTGGAYYENLRWYAVGEVQL